MTLKLRVHARGRSQASAQLRFAGALLLLTPVFLAGCPDLGYLLELAQGQAAVLDATVPIDDVLAGDTLTDSQRRKLRVIKDVRDYAAQSLALNVGDAYTLYYDSGNDPTAYNVSAARRDALVPRTWTFPLVGMIEYVGFFDREKAAEYGQRLEDAGWDVYIYGVDAYSTLGFLPDPVHSRFLNRSDGNIVETVIHELAHNTVYAPGQSVFNESLATFIGREGARRYLAALGDSGAAVAADLAIQYADEDLVQAWFADTTQRLRDYYNQDLPREELIAGRDAVFAAARDRFTEEVLPVLTQPERWAWRADLPTNNAYILLNGRYYRSLELFQQALDRVGGDFAAFRDVLRAAAASGAPWEYMASGG